MQNGGGFNWGTLGKPDYAQAGALVDSLPEQIRRKFRNDMREIMQNMVLLMWGQAARGGRGAGYCWPSEAWFACKLGKSVRTVQRCLILLREAGLLEWRRRKTKFGDWTSNLYTLGKVFLASLFARRGKKTQQLHHTTYLSDNDLKREYKPDEQRERPRLLADILGLHRAEPKIAPEAASSDGATEWGEEVDKYADRKAALKRQYASMPEDMK